MAAPTPPPVRPFAVAGLPACVAISNTVDPAHPLSLIEEDAYHEFRVGK
jgi:hypothetical protein